MQETFTGTTVEEAVQLGLKTWNLSENQVKIDIEEQGKKGLFGIGRREAVVTLTVIDPALKKYSLEELKQTNIQSAAAVTAEKAENELKPGPPDDEAAEEVVDNQKEAADRSAAKKLVTESADRTLDYLVQILKEMGIEATGEVMVKSNDVRINLISRDAARIIGKRGYTLNALQTVAQTHIQQTYKGYITVLLDIENYREKRKEILENLALNMAQKAQQTHEPVKFEPMPNYERKIIHQVLTRMSDIETYSEGREPHRYLVIKGK
ncbi:RNA-binding cell elongation regulator Jag/EloR [Macrococcus carouselicus]|uniref:RNA-binding protein KhpB n=1 Tax=Macrococcus carouselicus TaxID=69969 RepID=A0A9Q8CH80_9STAP|nr:RNA-binding cell elongation regulator Jag/EloR [Macrococcus carouselicus]TDM02166.1 protein jag [Macrococcus carouselicus]